jgi:hypothetical protein
MKTDLFTLGFALSGDSATLGSPDKKPDQS